MKFSRTCRFLLLLTITTVYRVTAQSADIRLSPAEPVSYQLPSDARIQSVATIGGVTLVVWGTTRNETDSTIRNELRFQLLHDTERVGTQHVIHGDAAMPSGFVQVIALSDRFVVFWNDHREGTPGIYLRVIDTAGTLIGDEERFSGGQVLVDSTFGMLSFGEGDSGRLLVWRSRASASGLYLRRIDGTGRPLGPEQRVGSDLTSVRFLDALPGITLLTVDGGHYIGIDPAGQIAARQIPDSQLIEPYYLNSDLSLDVIRDSVLQHLGSLYDTTVISRLTLPFIRDSVLEGPRVLERDSSGRLLVIFCPPWPAPGFGFPPADTRHPVVFYAAVVDSTGAISGPLEHQRFILDGFTTNSLSGSLISFQGYNQSHGCRLSRISIAIDRQYWYHGSLAESVRQSLGFQVAHGGIVSEGLGDAGLCAGIPPVIVARIGSDTFSIVQVAVGKQTLAFSAPTAHIGVKVPEWSPALFLNTGELCLIWSVGNRDSYALQLWKPFATNQIEDLGGIPAQQYTPTLPPGPSKLLTYNFHSWASPTEGSCPVILRHYRSDDMVMSPTYRYSVYTEWLALWLPTPHGWIRGEVASTWGYGPEEWFLPDSVCFDPDRREVVASYRIKDYAGSSRVLALDSAGNRTWTVDSLNANVLSAVPRQLVPVDSREILFVIADSLFRVRNNTVNGRYGLPSASGIPTYQRLLGRSFLRSYFADGTRRQLKLERFRFDGTMLGQGLVSFPAPVNDPRIIENHRDSTMIVVYQSNGVRAVRIAADLSTIIADDTISAARTGVRYPSAVVRNDTLFCVWEDYREGAASIYGNYLPIPRLAATIGTNTTAVTVDLSIRPNPVRERLDLEFSLPYPEPVDLTICNEKGSVVVQRRLEAATGGDYHLALEMSSLPAGFYLLHVRSAGLDTSRTLIVLH